MKALVWIIGLVVMALTVVTVVVGARTFEGTVVDKPYEAGLSWDADRRNRAALGWSVSLSSSEYRVGDNELLVVALDRDRHALDGAEVTIRVSRPSTAAFDKSYRASPRVEGGYLARVSLPLPGAWDLAIGVSLGAEGGSYAETILAR